MVIVFGSLNVDITVPVQHLPVEGETVLGKTYTMAPGGKGANQALAARMAGAKVCMAGKVGKDPFAEQALASLKAASVNLSAIEPADEPTACALIIVDDKGRNQIAVASGANLAARSGQISEEWLRPDTLLLLQMEVPVTENWALITHAKEKGARILLNVAPAGKVPEEVLKKLDWLVVNEIEVLAVAADHGYAGNDPIEAAKHLNKKAGVITIVTLGDQGARAFTMNGAWTVPALPVAPVDTTAAGDSFVGAFAAALDRGGSLEESLAWGSVAGSLACLKYGAQSSVPHLSAIQERLKDIKARPII